MREELGLTQKELSNETGIPNRTIENWEGGINSPPAWVQKLLFEKLESIERRKTMEPYEKAMKEMLALAPALEEPKVRFTAIPFHGKGYRADDEPFSIDATYVYGDARDLCDWMTNPALVAGEKSYHATVFLKPPYDTEKVNRFYDRITSWHKTTASRYELADVPQEVFSTR
jgi:transcriptional regulator with XRE-family HTH domain